MRNIPTVTRWLLGINVGMFLLMFIFKGVDIDLNDMLGLHFFLASDFNILQLITYQFMHGGFEHIFFNMFALWMFGCLIEQTFGSKRFLVYYLGCGIGAGLFQEVAQFVSFYIACVEQIPNFSFSLVGEVAHNSAATLNQWTTVGASGAVYGVLLAFGMMYPEERMFIFPLPVPIKAKWFVVGYFVIEIGLALTQPGDNVAHLAHVGGMVVGFFLIRHWQNPLHRQHDWYDNTSNFGQTWQRLKQRFASKPKYTGSDTAYNRHENDYQYNSEQKVTQAEIDAILDKIRRSGYESLTKAEKQKLFDISQRKGY